MSRLPNWARRVFAIGFCSQVGPLRADTCDRLGQWEQWSEGPALRSTQQQCDTETGPGRRCHGGDGEPGGGLKKTLGAFWTDPMCIGINPQRARTYNFLCRPRRGEVALARKAPVRTRRCALFPSTPSRTSWRSRGWTPGQPSSGGPHGPDHRGGARARCQSPPSSWTRGVCRSTRRHRRGHRAGAA